MQKSVYSLMLSDSVVSGIDMLALKKGTNRSNLINMILAEYLSLTTPEMRIENIFRQMESLFSSYESVVPVMTPNRPVMSVKSTLEYKYRPTVKYDVRLYRQAQMQAIGDMSVTFRTQSHSLIEITEEFFKFWYSLEKKYIKHEYFKNIQYSLDDGKFTRTIMLFDANESSLDVIAQGITDYIKCLDLVMKGVVSGRYSSADAERIYTDYLKNAQCLI